MTNTLILIILSLLALPPIVVLWAHRHSDPDYWNAVERSSDLAESIRQLEAWHRRYPSGVDLAAERARPSGGFPHQLAQAMTIPMTLPIVSTVTAYVPIVMSPTTGPAKPDPKTVKPKGKP